MKNYVLQIMVTLIFTICSFSISAQEVAQPRTTTYTFELNKIKHQSQVDGVVTKTEAIPNVKECKLDWLNYSMLVTVNEGGDKGSLSLEKIKAILLENNVALVKFTKEISSK